MLANPIQNEEDYLSAICQVDSLWYAPTHSNEHSQLEILVALIDFYEQNLFPMRFPDPIKALKFYKTQLSIQDESLDEIFGSSKATSEILDKIKPLTLLMVSNLSEKLKIPAECLISSYELFNTGVAGGD